MLRRDWFTRIWAIAAGGVAARVLPANVGRRSRCGIFHQFVRNGDERFQAGRATFHPADWDGGDAETIHVRFRSSEATTVVGPRAVIAVTDTQ